VVEQEEAGMRGEERQQRSMLMVFNLEQRVVIRKNIVPGLKPRSS
jgi:hypothetical protein